MSNSDSDIIVDDPTAPDDNSPSVVSGRAVEIVACLALLALAVTLGLDNYSTGTGWDSTGPGPGYFPFYLPSSSAARAFTESRCADGRSPSR